MREYAQIRWGKDRVILHQAKAPLPPNGCDDMPQHG
jgi:hypothetical protein